MNIFLLLVFFFRFVLLSFDRFINFNNDFSKDITRLQKHLKKMFAGITSIDVDEENLLVTALNSREGERVQLVKPVNIKVRTSHIG